MPKTIKYRYFKNFDGTNFLIDLNNINVRLDKENPNQCCQLELVNKHAHLKKKTLGENLAFLYINNSERLFIRGVH